MLVANKNLEGHLLERIPPTTVKHLHFGVPGCVGRTIELVASSWWIMVQNLV